MCIVKLLSLCWTMLATPRIATTYVGKLSPAALGTITFNSAWSLITNMTGLMDVVVRSQQVAPVSVISLYSKAPACTGNYNRFSAIAGVAVLPKN